MPARCNSHSATLYILDSEGDFTSLAFPSNFCEDRFLPRFQLSETSINEIDAHKTSNTSDWIEEMLKGVCRADRLPQIRHVARIGELWHAFALKPIMRKSCDDLTRDHFVVIL